MSYAFVRPITSPLRFWDFDMIFYAQVLVVCGDFVQYVRAAEVPFPVNAQENFFLRDFSDITGGIRSDFEFLALFYSCIQSTPYEFSALRVQFHTQGWIVTID